MGNYVADATWGGQPVQAGVTVYWSGVSVATWPAEPGPAPYLVEAMLADGVAAASIKIVVWASPGSLYQIMRDTCLIGARLDWLAIGASPQVVWMWHGESASNDLALATAYEEDMVQWGCLCDGIWPGVWLQFQELLSESYTYWDTTHASIRAAIARMAGAEEVASKLPTLLGKADTVHASSGPGGGTDVAAQRAWALVT